MTKKQLIKYLEQKQKETLSMCREQFDKLACEYQSEFEKKIELEKYASEISKAIANLEKQYYIFVKNVEHICEENKNFNVGFYHGYSSIPGFLGNWNTKSQVMDNLLHNMRDKSASKLKIEDDRIKALDAIKSEYSKLICNVQAMKNAKQAIDYLQSLGFEIDEPKNEDITALATPIDTKWLFIKKEE